MKRLITFPILLFLFISFPDTSFGVEISLFENQYSRTKGKPNNFTDTFIGKIGEGKLVFKNGDEDGRHRISSAVIKVNGVVILNTNDFNQKIYNIEASVNLDENNSISVEMRSKIGSHLNIQIVQEMNAEGGTVIGSEGGLVEVTDSNSPIYGAKVNIPEGALENQTIILIDNGIIVDDPELIGIPISFMPDGLAFSEEVEITIPLQMSYSSEDLLMLMVYNGESDSYEYAGGIAETNSGDIAITTNVSHFSSYSFKKAVDIFIDTQSMVELSPILLLIKNEIETTNDCSELDNLKSLLEDYQENYEEFILSLDSLYKWCQSGVLSCEMIDWVNVGKDFLISSALFALPPSAPLAAVSLALMTTDLIRLAPCSLCYIKTSWLNPDYFDAWVGNYISEYGIHSIDLALIECNVPGDNLWSDNFEDGIIDPSLWEIGGEKRGCGPPCGSNRGSWNISQNEIIDSIDGYLELRVWGPASGYTYGAEAWVRNTTDFNDGNNHIINFTWEPDFGDYHYNFFFIQVTDGYISPENNLHWNHSDYPGTVNLLRNPGTGWGFENEASPGKLNWSIEIDSSGIARLYDGPDATGTIKFEGAIDPAYPWYLRFMVSDGTSAGFPGGDAWLNLYDFSVLP